jgi:SAM-dependent methyltransferase
MFFAHLIRSIRPHDRVLEVGPGASPHPRANEFLEYDFVSNDEVLRQRGDAISRPVFGGRKVTRYSGSKFPYSDREFDYVIVSQVIEHVEDPAAFMSEVYRVGSARGYVEFPLPPYDYLFDFDVHRHFVWLDEAARVINFVPKDCLNLSSFSSITSQLRRSLELGWDEFIAENLQYFFVGAEFDRPIDVVQKIDLSEFTKLWVKDGRTIGRRLSRKITKIVGS